MTYKAAKQHVANRGVPPDAFLDVLVAWGKRAPDEIFASNQFSDIYSSVFNTLGPWEGVPHRRAVMLEVLRVLAGFESSWNWNEGRDTTNPTSVTPDTVEAGPWQVSANAMNFGQELRDLVLANVGTLDGNAFQKAMKQNHPLAIEFIARLLRRTTRHNGFVHRPEFHASLSKDAVAEFQALMGEAKTKGTGRESCDELPSPVSLEAPATPQRYLAARADDRVRVGVPFTLTARISTENIPSAVGRGSGALTGDVTGKLKISIYAPGFISNDGTQREIDVPATGNSSWVPFELVATKEGIQPIEVLAWKNSVQVGGVTISVGVGATQPSESWVQSGIDMREPAGGEYTLEVVFERVLNKYRFQLRGDTGENWPSMYSDHLEGTRQAAYSDVISRLNTEARNANKLSEYAQREWLKGMDATLYNLLVPIELKQALWENRDKVKYLNLISRDEPMPWELLYISDPAGTAGGVFIADSATVTRWRYGPPAERKLSKKSPYFVLPNGSPTKAQDEVNYARNKLGAGTIIDQLDDLLKFLEAGQFSLLHFASHNVANPTVTGDLYIPFGGSKFDITFMEAWSKNQFRAQRPLVFMNSCTSGGSVPLYTEMVGWADKFLGAGCAAFIGSLWEIRDTSALTFAKNFYDEVTGGKNLGESMRTARNALKSSDPTYLAYTLYGNPFASFS
jgi:hypothetical protein